MLNDKNIYDEGCTLRIAYSKQRELDIRTDGPSSRDFTRKPMTDRELRELDRPNPNPGILGGSGSAAAVAAAAAAMKAASGPGSMNMSGGQGGLSGPAPLGPGVRSMPPSPGMGMLSSDRARTCAVLAESKLLNIVFRCNVAYLHLFYC